MNPVFSLLAPVALLLPGVAGVELARELPVQIVEAATSEAELADVPQAEADLASASAISHLLERPRETVFRQVSIEQRVTIRVAPRMPASPVAFDSLPTHGAGPRFAEKKMGKCVPVSGIVGVQYRDANRLVLHLRDRRMVSATLDKSCRARDFYSGFYVAKNADGMLCVGRDEIRARSGANCQISGMRQLVEDDD